MTKPTYSELEAENLRVRGLLQRQWVSVEERLPELSEPVLIFVPDAWEFTGYRFMGILCDDGWRSFAESAGGVVHRKVTHWMPLPDPPNFRESSSLVSQGAESADIGKLDSVNKKENL